MIVLFFFFFPNGIDLMEKYEFTRSNLVCTRTCTYLYCIEAVFFDISMFESATSFRKLHKS